MSNYGSHPKPNVVDLSFLDMTSLTEMAEKQEALSPDAHGPINAGALRICSNQFEDISRLYSESSKIIRVPAELKWLDLSCNVISSIPEEIASFRDCSVMYLHGNVLGNFRDLLPLGQLKGLSKLTLHGNPVEDLPNYRAFIILLCPSLRMLDFSVVTPQDREAAQFFSKAFDAATRQRKKKSDD